MLRGEQVHRRVVRKGTSSCWECKRRKKRCCFDSSTVTACVSCRRSGVQCHSQEVEEPGTDASGHLEVRIRHIEGLVEQLFERRAIQTPESRCVDRNLRASTATRNENAHRHELDDRASLVSRCVSLSGYLQAVLPIPTVAAQIILSGRSPFSWMWPSAGPDTAAQRPSRSSSDPVMLARSLIHLALCLIQPSFKSSHSGDTCISNDAIGETARSYVRTAQQVTNQDSLMRSLDGLETLRLEALYQIHIGNMQTGCMIFRRALDMAQTMELHRLPLTAEYREKNLWFSLAFANQFQALAYGHPSALVDYGIGLFACSGSGDLRQKLDEHHIGIAGRIVRRNVRITTCYDHGTDQENLLLDSEETRIIADGLQEAARCVPLAWWALPKRFCSTETEAIGISARLMTQLHQSYLVILNYQPHVIHALHHASQGGCPGSSDEMATWVRRSMLASLNAAREMIVKLPYFLEFPLIPASLKGLEHKICLALSITLLVYLYTHSDNTEALKDQRPHDISLVLQTIERLESLHEIDGPEAQREDLTILKQLCRAEQAAADGVRHIFTSDWCAGGQSTLDNGPDSSNGVSQHRAASVAFPYFGRISIWEASSSA